MPLFFSSIHFLDARTEIRDFFFFIFLRIKDTTIIRSETSWHLKAQLLANLIILTMEGYRKKFKTPWKRNLEALGLFNYVRRMNFAVIPILANMFSLRLLMANLFGFMFQNIKVKILWEGLKIFVAFSGNLNFSKRMQTINPFYWLKIIDNEINIS